MKCIRPASNIEQPIGKDVSERLEERTENSRTYNLTKDGHDRRLIVGRGPLHYKDETGTFRDIDLTIDTTDRTYNIESAPYCLEVPKKGISFVYRSRSGGELEVRLVEIGDVPLSKLVNLNTIALIENNNIWWKNVVPGLDLCLDPRPNRLKIVAKVANSETPRVLKFICIETNNRTFASRWDNINAFDAVGEEINVFTSIEEFVVDEPDCHVYGIKYDITTQIWGATDLKDPSIGDWIEGAQFPLTLDPDITEYVSQGSDDAYSDSDGDTTSVITTGDDVKLGRRSLKLLLHIYTGGVRFQTIAIDQGVTITLANLKVKINTLAGSPNVTWYGDDKDDVPTWSAGSRPDQITKTTASTNVQPTSTGNKTWNITSIVQEIVDRLGWVNNNDMRFAGFNNAGNGNYFHIDSYEKSGGEEAILEIDFSSATAHSGDTTLFIHGHEKFGSNLFIADTNSDRIIRCDVNGNWPIDIITGLAQVVALTLDPIAGKLYWVDSLDDIIRRSNLEGSDQEDMFTNGVSGAISLAIDYNNQKIYWGNTTFENDQIVRADYDGSNLEILVSDDITLIRSIDLDLQNDKMYWSDDNGKIKRSDLDGSGIETLATGIGWATSVCVDPPLGKIYYTDANADKIIRADLDGSNPEDIITSGIEVPYGLSADTINRKIYWVDYNDNVASRANSDGSILEELLTGLDTPSDTALIPGLNEKELFILGHGYITSGIDLFIEGHEPANSSTDLFINGCVAITGTNLLYVYGYDSLSASSALFIEGLIENSETTTLFIWGHEKTYTSLFIGDYVADKIIRSHADGTSSIDIVTGLLNPYTIATDQSAEKLYWGDVDLDKIQRSDFDGSNIEDVITSGITYPRAMAIDHIGGKIYWADAMLDKISRANLDGSNQEDIITSGLSYVNGMDLDLKAGKMYWSDSFNTTISRANLDGSEIEIVLSGLDYPTSVAVEPDRGKLYWTDVIANKIAKANLDGSNQIDIITSGVDNPNGLSLDWVNHKLYWTDTALLTASRAKTDGSAQQIILVELSGPLDTALGPIPQKSLFVQGYEAINVSTDLFIGGHKTVSGAITLYIDGYIAASLTKTLFINGHETGPQTNIPLYVNGKDQQSNDIDLSITGYSTETSDTYLFIQVPESTTSNIDLFIGGLETASNNIDLFSHGYQTINESMDLIVEGHEISTNNCDLFIHGHNPAVSNIPLSIHGFQPETSSLELFICGLEISTGDCDLFIHGFDQLTNTINLFIAGHDPASSGIDPYIYGYDFITNNTTLFIGPYEAAPLGLNLFVYGHSMNSSNIELSVAGHIEVSGEIPLFIYGRDLLFNNINLFIHGYEQETDNIELFLAGHLTHTSNIDLFTLGHQVSTSSLNLCVLGNGAPTPAITNLFIGGKDTLIDDSDLFIHGYQQKSSITELYINGHESTTSNIVLFLEGEEELTDGLNLFVHGFDDCINSLDLYLYGHQTVDNSMAISIRGDQPIISAPTLFIHGFKTTQFVQIEIDAIRDATIISDAFADTNFGLSDNLIVGHNAVTNRAAILFNISGIIPSGAYIKNANIYALGLQDASGQQEFRSYLLTKSWLEDEVTWNNATSGDAWNTPGGDYDTALYDNWNIDTTSGILKTDIDVTNILQFAVNSGLANFNVLLKEHIETSVTTKLASVQNPSGGPILVVEYSEVHPDLTIYIGGLEQSTSGTDLFIHGRESLTSNTTLAIVGDEPETSGSTLYIYGHQLLSSGIDLLIHGYTIISSGITLAVRGSGIFPESGTFNLFIHGLTTREPLVCPTLDPTVSIQIGEDLIEIYQSRIDALINQLGKNVLLEFDPVKEPCPNCDFDSIRNRSNGIYKVGGPRPFSRGRKCPYCKGHGFLETTSTKCIKCLIKWNPRDIENYGISLRDYQGVVRLKTMLTEADDIKRTKTALVDYDKMDIAIQRVRIIRGPIPVGLRHDRYCISFWELL